VSDAPSLLREIGLFLIKVVDAGRRRGKEEGKEEGKKQGKEEGKKWPRLSPPFTLPFIPLSSLFSARHVK